MDEETNYSRDKNDMKKPSSRRNHYIGRDTVEWNKGVGSVQRTRKGRQSIMERRQNSLCEWKNLCAKQLEDQGKNTSRKP